MRIAVSMRVVDAVGYSEPRDAISHDWTRRLFALQLTPVLIPNAVPDPAAYLDVKFLPQIEGMELPRRDIEQQFCPVLRDRKISSKDPSTTYKGVKVYFYNDLARQRFEKDPERYVDPKILPQLKGKMDGMAIRVPTPNVSLVDLSVETEKDCDAASINAAFKKAAEGPLKNILQYSDAPIVSIDQKGDPHSATLDAPLTTVLEGRMVKVIAWYDNEWGYSCRVRDLIKMMATKG